MDITSYDSIEEMQADMARAHAAADKQTIDAQRAITYGDYYMNIAHLNDGLCIFGRVYTAAEHIRSAFNLRGYGRTAEEEAAQLQTINDALDGATDLTIENAVRVGMRLSPDEIEVGDIEEARWEIEATLTSHERGYLFGRAFSEIVPDGELGSVHRSQLVPISYEQFRNGQQCGWNLQRLATDVQWFQPMLVVAGAVEQDHGRQAAMAAACQSVRQSAS